MQLPLLLCLSPEVSYFHAVSLMEIFSSARVDDIRVNGEDRKRSEDRRERNSSPAKLHHGVKYHGRLLHR